MKSNTLDASVVRNMFLAGARNLESKKEWINELNVFPVPDGDTGTNMTATIMSAAKEVAALENPTMQQVCKAISSGSLRGARGNSGVILSQILRGFTKGISAYDTIDIVILSKSCQKAVETAYKAVMKPKEGTILTVAKGMADKAVELSEADITMEEFIAGVIEEGQAVLNQTPEMLPVLKQAGVVDSGGQGLLEVIKGCFDGFLGKEVDYSTIPVSSATPVTTVNNDIDTSHIQFGYCTEFIIMLDKTFTAEMEQELKSYLLSIGDSLVVVADDEIVKVHVHTNDPGLAIQRALTYGSLSNMKIDNMRLEHQEKVIKDAEKKATEQATKEPVMEHKETAFIAVSIGNGMDDIFKGLGVDYIIAGGQTMNPSTEDMLNAIEKVNADTIFILPNNKNIILAAEQAVHLVEDKRIIVIPTKTVPQGITAIINYVPEKSVEENAACMKEEITHVRTGQVTYAVRDTSIDGYEIHENDIMGIGDKAILTVGKELLATTKDMIDKMVDEEIELIGIYYGAEVTKEQAEEVAAYVEETYPDLELDVQEGGQPIYYFIISAE